MQIEGHLDWNDLSVSEERYLNMEYLMNELIEFFEKNREIWNLTDQDFARILGLNFEQFCDSARYGCGRHLQSGRIQILSLAFLHQG